MVNMVGYRWKGRLEYQAIIKCFVWSWEQSKVEHISVGVSAMKFRLFRMSWEARGNLRCIVNISFVYLAFNRAKRIHQSFYCWLTRVKIIPFLKVKMNSMNIYQRQLIWIFVMKKTWDLSEIIPEFTEVKKGC